MNEAQKEKLYLLFHEKVARYVASRISDPHTAEDVVSIVFLKVYQNLDRFDPSRAALSTWIFTIAKNVVINHYRMQKPCAELDEDMADSAQGIEEQILSAEMLERLAAALERLDQRERDLLILHYYERRSLKDIAESMRISYSSAKLLHRQALSDLQRMLK